MRTPADEFLLAWDHELAGEWQRAERMLELRLEELIRSDHDCGWIDIYAQALARLRTSKGNVLGAREALRSASQACPDRLGICYGLVCVEIKLGRRSDAEAAFQRFLALTRTSPAELAPAYLELVPLVAKDFEIAFGNPPV